ncbi:unnamed protein product [Effrenium voratum]|uniref:Uncharacterized protein n=1 Tax=Effrenium voratum TaxID=2562239 RepID=A0AA36IH96_9DINO|nr:unnamed protein product [Effrenium voratum]
MPVIFPMAVPDEGTFEWLDDFLSKHPRYVELSDRAIGDWAEQSGVARNKTYTWKHSNDKPDLQTGLPLLDDFSARKILGVVAPTQPRNYVVMEIKSNLLKDERSHFIKRFKRPGFKVVAQVMMGEPPAEFKAAVHKTHLEEKQKKLDEEWEQRKAEKERERAAEEARRQADADADARAKAEATAAAEAVRAQLMAQGSLHEMAVTQPAAPSVETVGEAPPSVEAAVAASSAPAGEGKPDVVMTEVKEEKVEPVPEEPRPVATLTEEEQKVWFKAKAAPDLTSWTLGGLLAAIQREGRRPVCWLPAPTQGQLVPGPAGASEELAELALTPAGPDSQDRAAGIDAWHCAQPQQASLLVERKGAAVKAW